VCGQMEREQGSVKCWVSGANVVSSAGSMESSVITGTAGFQRGYRCEQGLRWPSIGSGG
jgi:hypothetical protein